MAGYRRNRELLESHVQRLGGRIEFLDPLRFAYRIEFKRGRPILGHGTNYGVNLSGAAAVARDKNYTSRLLAHLGYPTLPQRLVLRNAVYDKVVDRHPDLAGAFETLRTAPAAAARLGFPVVVKPNDSTQGKGVFIVDAPGRLRACVRSAFMFSDVVLIEKFSPGREYRVLVFDGNVRAAYSKSAPIVVGDGVSTIRMLVKRRVDEYRAAGIKIDTLWQDRRVLNALARQGRRFDSVLKRGARVKIMDNANLSVGGAAADFTARVAPFYRRYFARAARDVGLNLCGFDFMCRDITKAPRNPKAPGIILEINGAPDVGHYASLGDEPRRVVDGIFGDLALLLRDISLGRRAA